MSYRTSTLLVTVAVVGVVVGSGAATLAAPAGSARPAVRARTLFAGHHRIYGFALGSHRITWTSRMHRRGGHSGCGMYVRSLRTGRTLRAPLPTGCGVTFANPATLVVASGVAAWITRRSGCGISECFWDIATITGGETKPRVFSVSFRCPPPACGLRHRVGKAASPQAASIRGPSLAGRGDLLVYSDDVQVRRIVGRHTVPFASPPSLGFPPSGIDGLAVGGGTVEVSSTALNPGDGCGCLFSPAWSPDGSRIAYLRGKPYYGTPALMDADGSARRDLSSTGSANEGPVWSPDGKQLAYGEYSSASDSEGIWVANADGSVAHEIGLGDNPTWSPDGSKIAFVSAGCNNTTAAISVMNPDGTNVQQIASFSPGPTCLDYGIAWSPDGTRIAFSLGGMLEVMNADGSNPHPLTPGVEPSWSPDSSQIVFRTDPFSSQSANGLLVIGADGTGLRQLTQGPDDHPSWSPDGQSIVFSSDRNNPYAWGGSLGSPELYLIDPDGSNLRPLSFTRPAGFQSQTNFYSANGNPLPSLPGVPTLAGDVAAVGSTNANGSHEITLFDATTGVQVAAVNVGGKLANGFGIGGADSHWIVYRLGPSIHALNLAARKTILLAKPAAPMGLSVSGRRVAWAENINGHGRIRTLELPN